MRSAGYRGDSLTPVLVIIVLCFIVYLATEAGDRFLGYNLIGLLGLQPITFFQKPWTIITAIFVHGGFWHVAFNMLTLFFFGRFLVGLVGTRSFYIIYFLGGIVGNIFFMVLAFLGLFTSPYSTVIGASGAVFALGGVLTALTPKLKVIIMKPVFSEVLNVKQLRVRSRYEEHILSFWRHAELNIYSREVDVWPC